MPILETAIIWLRAFAAKLTAGARKLTGPEVMVTLTLAAATTTESITLARNPSLGKLAIVLALAIMTVVLLPPMLMDNVILRENLARTHAAMVRTNAAKPTGAPRVAEVACRHGDVHRFVYGPDGWSLAGPGVERLPEAEVSSP